MAGWGVTSSQRSTPTAPKGGGVAPAIIGGGAVQSSGSMASASDIARLLTPQVQGGAVPGTLGVYAGGPNPNAGKPTAAPASSSVPATAAVTPGSPVVNKAEANPTATNVANKLASSTADPRATGIVDTLMERAKGDMGLGREIDRGAQDIRSNALAGIAGDRLSRVARGVNGTGVDTYDANKQSDQQRADVNRMVNDRTIAAEAMRNDLLGSTANLSMGVAGQATGNQIAGGNMALNVSGQQLQAQGQNTAAANAQSQLDLQRQQEARQERNDVWNMNETAAARAQDAQMRSFQTILNFLT